MTLTEFLLARITEDEARARHWQDEWSKNGGLIDLVLTPGPARVLAECEAKRRIVGYLDVLLHTPGDSWRREDAVITLTFLTQPYVDHPEWREDWRS